MISSIPKDTPHEWVLMRADRPDDGVAIAWMGWSTDGEVVIGRRQHADVIPGIQALDDMQSLVKKTIAMEQARRQLDRDISRLVLTYTSGFRGV